MRRAAFALVATAAGLVLMPAPAAGGPHARAADSDWVSERNVGGSARYFAFTVSLTGSGLTIAAGESLPWARAYGCTIAASTVVYDFTQVGKDAAGNKLYNGKGLGWTAGGGVCTTTGLGGAVSAVLKPGSDGFQTPKLAYGPDNVIAVYLGTYKAGDTMPTGADDVFYRKGGTTSGAGGSGGSGGASSGTCGGGSADGDDEPPDVEALASTGKRGAETKLRFTSSDDSGEACEQLTVYKGKKVVGRISTPLGERDPDETYSTTWKGKKTIYGKLRFCVVGIDAAGNKSKQSCAALTLKK